MNIKPTNLHKITTCPFKVVALSAAFFLFTSCIFDSVQIVKDSDVTPGGTLQVTAAIPGDTPETRVSFEQDDIDIKLAWQVGDEVNFLFTQNNQNKEQQVVTLSAEDISPDGKKATFTLNIPGSISDGEFNLYGVYGGGGLDSENPRLVKLPTVAQSTSSSLKEIEKNKAMVLVFSQTDISSDTPNIIVAFKHIGSLFNIQVKNTGGVALNKVTEARLTASSAIPAYSNSGAETYDFTTGAFSGTQTTFLTFRPVSSSNIVSQGILEFWAWIPMDMGGNTEASWPALGLEIVSDGAPIATPGTKPARTATVGKTYYLNATYDGSALTFAEAADMTVAPGKLADFRDGNLYNTVAIGDQTWMAENLAYLPSVNKSNQSTTDPFYYVYDNTSDNVAVAKGLGNYITYGVLYNWPAALTACPDGWHLPSEAEWTTLQEYLIANGYNYDDSTTGNKIAKSLASESGWDSSTVEGSPGYDDYSAYKNKSGFTGLPGGYRGAGGNFTNRGKVGSWWSSTPYGTNGAGEGNLDFEKISLTLTTTTPRSRGYSVRCVKD